MPGLSDHDIVLTDNKVSCKGNQQIRRTIHLWKKANITQMKQDTQNLSNKILENKNNTDINQVWNQLKQGINNIQEKHVSQKQTSSKFTNSWANTTIRKLSNSKRKAYNRAKKQKCPENCLKYKKIKALTQKATRQAHNSYVRDIVGPKLKENSKQFWGYVN